MRDKSNNKKVKGYRPLRLIVAYFVLCLLLTVSIFLEAMQPPTLGSGSILYLDKIVHFCVFGLLTFLVNKLLQLAEVEVHWQHMLTIIMVVTGIGLLDESIQFISPDRHPSALDLLADFVGVLVVTLFMFRKSTLYQLNLSIFEKFGVDKQSTTCRGKIESDPCLPGVINSKSK